MRRSDFSFDLPDALIAQHPPAERSAGRLLCLDGASGQCADRRVRDLPQVLQRGDLLVCNDTQVIPARLRAQKTSGGRVELLIERIIEERTALMFARPARGLAAGARLILEDGDVLEVLGREGELLRIRATEPFMQLAERCGHVPLPPYIRRPDGPCDRERYQTVYARSPGAVAAPTAGLHFDAALFAELAASGVSRAMLTLHVGAGTFAPIRVDELSEHRMHSERFRLDASLIASIEQTRQAGGRIVAVGTTVVRALESAAAAGPLRPGERETRIFIYPGFRFRVVDVLITNFHLPESTLLMLVCAFAGRQRVLAAYRHAVAAGYRFFSYGDAMCIIGDPAARGADGTP